MPFTGLSERHYAPGCFVQKQVPMRFWGQAIVGWQRLLPHQAMPYAWPKLQRSQAMPPAHDGQKNGC